MADSEKEPKDMNRGELESKALKLGLTDVKTYKNRDAVQEAVEQVLDGEDAAAVNDRYKIDQPAPTPPAQPAPSKPKQLTLKERFARRTVSVYKFAEKEGMKVNDLYRKLGMKDMVRTMTNPETGEVKDLDYEA